MVLQTCCTVVIYPSVDRTCPPPGVASLPVTEGVVLAVLGQASAEVDGVPVRLGGPRARSLLVALALSPDHRLDRSDLVAEVWPDGPPRSAARSLAAYLSRLRAAFQDAIGRPLLHPSGEQVHLRLAASDRLDVHDLLRALAIAADADALETALAGWAFQPEPLPRGPVVTAALKRVASERQEARRRLIRLLVADPRTPGDRVLTHVRALLQEGADDRDWAYHLVLEVVQREGGHSGDARIRRLVGGAADQVLPPTEPAPLAAGGRIVPPLTSFVGRDHDLQQLMAAVTDHRLVTVTGPAGVGKSRLAVEVARREPWGSGAMIAKLAGFDGPDVSLAVLGVLGEAEHAAGGGWPGRGITSAALQGLDLLVLDACEHLVDRLAPWVGHLLASQPALRVLATSRRRLGVPGEQVLRLRPLALTGAAAAGPAVPGGDRAHPSPAVQLFLDRARSRRASTAAAAGELAAVERIVRHLDGLPLAIELAAAGTEALAPSAIAERLTAAGEGRTGEAPDEDGPPAGMAPAMSAALRWSESLLAPAERRLFQRLSVLASSFDLDAAEAVGATEGPGGALPLLTRLVDHSLLELEPAADGGLRYRMLDSMRAYAGRALRARGEDEPCRLALLRHLIPRAAELGHLLNTADGTRLSARMHADLNSVEAVLAWAMAHGHVVEASHLIAALSRFWAQAGMAARGHHWMRQAIAHSEGLSDGDQGRLLSSLMLIEWMQGDHEGALDAAQRLAPVAERLGSSYLRACSTLLDGAVAVHTGERARAAGLLARTHDLLDDADEIDAFRREWLRGIVMLLQGVLAREAGDVAAARETAERMASSYRDLGDMWGWGVSCWLRGTVERQAGDLPAATEALAEPVAQIVARNELVGMAFHVSAAVGCALELGEEVLSGQLVGAAEGLWELLGMPPMPIVGEQFTADREAVVARLPADLQRRTARQGRAWTLAEQAAAVRRVATLAAAR